MKVALFCTIAITCVVGLALADFDDVYGSMIGGGYGAGYSGGYGGGKVGYGGSASYVPIPAYPGAGSSGGVGSGGLLGLLGLLFVLFFLFGNQNANSDQIILINSTLV